MAHAVMLPNYYCMQNIVICYIQSKDVPTQSVPSRAVSAMPGCLQVSFETSSNKLFSACRFDYFTFPDDEGPSFWDFLSFCTICLHSMLEDISCIGYINTDWLGTTAFSHVSTLQITGTTPPSVHDRVPFPD